MVRAIAFLWRQAIALLIAVVLSGLLTACGGDRPPQAVIEQAIQLQVEQTQAQLRKQLFRSGADLPVATVDRVKVKKQQSQAIDAAKGYRIEGTYSLSIDSPQQHITRRQNPFEVYLQQTGEEAWSLARPLPDGRWETRPFPTEVSDQLVLEPTPDT